MRATLTTIAWPAIAGVLAAILILDNWVSSQASADRAVTSVQSYREAVAAATPAVVNIFTAKLVTRRQSPLLNNPFMPIPRGVPRQRVERSLGSGVIMRDSGYILTNNHVIAGADEIRVQLSDGRITGAQVVGSDEVTDLAALRIDLPNLTATSIADSDLLSVGDVVLAIGNPLGFGSSVTQGIVSGLGRFGMNPNLYEGYIQTDAVIHPGNSGGALVDPLGALVGINTFIYTAADGGNGMTGIGVSLAIPSNVAEFVMDDLIRYGRVIRGWLGVQVEQVMDENGGQPKLLVMAVKPDGPADRAGLGAGDVITHFGNEPISDVRLAMYEISLLRPGDRLEMIVERDSGSETLTAIIGNQPDLSGAAI